MNMNNEYVTLYSGLAKELVILSERILKEDVFILSHKLVGKILHLELTNGQILELDISDYLGEVTDAKINALDAMMMSIINGDLIAEYDDAILDYTFELDGNDLIVDDEEEFVEFQINENGELEALY